MTVPRKTWQNGFAGLFLCLIVSACMDTSSQRMGMVKDPETGLQFGSAINGSLFTDPAFYPNKNIKISTRNTSGDSVFDLNSMISGLEGSYRDKGYTPTNGSDFGLKLDVNVRYSGMYQTTLAQEFAVIGLSAGAIQGYRTSADQGPAIGLLGGAIAGGILGSQISEDTYIVIASVHVGIRDGRRKSRKVVSFSRSAKLKTYEEFEETGYGKWRETATIEVAVFAGGTNTPQSRVSEAIRDRLTRIVANIL